MCDTTLGDARLKRLARAHRKLKAELEEANLKLGQVIEGASDAEQMRHLIDENARLSSLAGVEEEAVGGVAVAVAESAAPSRGSVRGKAGKAGAAAGKAGRGRGSALGAAGAASARGKRGKAAWPAGREAGRPATSSAGGALSSSSADIQAQVEDLLDDKSLLEDEVAELRTVCDAFGRVGNHPFWCVLFVAFPV